MSVHVKAGITNLFEEITSRIAASLNAISDVLSADISPLLLLKGLMENKEQLYMGANK